MSDYDGLDRRRGEGAEALAHQDRLARSLRLIALGTAAFLALAITVALVVGFGSIRRAKDYARASARDSAVARRLAVDLKALAETNKVLLERGAPCLPGDPPDSPACQRAAASAKVVADAIGAINASLAAGLEAHDANVIRRLVRLEAIVAGRSAPPAIRTPITAAPRPPTTPAPRATTPPPPVTTAPAPAAPTTTTTTRPGRAAPPTTTTTAKPGKPPGPGMDRCRPKAGPCR